MTASTQGVRSILSWSRWHAVCHAYVPNVGGSTIRTTLNEFDPGDCDACLRVNLAVVWVASVMAAARMTDGGSITNISSPAASARRDGDVLNPDSVEAVGTRPASPAHMNVRAGFARARSA